MQRATGLSLTNLMRFVGFALSSLLLVTSSAQPQPHVSILKGGDEGATPLAFLPDGKTLAGIRYSRQSRRKNLTQVTLWDLKTGHIKKTLEIPPSSMAIAFSPDSKTMAIGWGDQFTGRVQLWNVQSGKLKRTLAKGIIKNGTPSGLGPVFGLAFSADARSLKVGVIHEGELEIAGEVVVLGSRTGRTLRTVPLARGALGPFVFSPTGHIVASSVELYSSTTGKLIRTLRISPKPKRASESDFDAVCFSANGKYLITSSSAQKIMIWNIRTGKVAKTLTNIGESYRPFNPGLAISKKGDLIAIGGMAGIRLVPTKWSQR